MPDVDEDRSSWPIHAKDGVAGCIDLDALDNIACTAATRGLWEHASGWVRDISRYATVPTEQADKILSTRLRAPQVQRLLDCGLIAETPMSAAKGSVNVFATPEPTKKRYRCIKEPRVINERLGKDTLRPCHLPSKGAICNLVNEGEWMLPLDFSAYFDQIKLDADISNLMCFRHAGKHYRACTLPMGQRQAVEVAQNATLRLLDFDTPVTKLAYIDNVIFVGKYDDVVDAGVEYVRRCKEVGAKINELDTSKGMYALASRDIPKLVTQQGEWCGVYLDLKNKTTRLCDKTVDKTAASYALRNGRPADAATGREAVAPWTWRRFAAHVGLLFWAWGIIDLPMPDFFPLLRFVSEMGKHLTEHEDKWDETAIIWPSVASTIDQWTKRVIDNAPRAARKATQIEWTVACDASAWGWGYVAVNNNSGAVQACNAQWTTAQKFKAQGKHRHSTYAEPEGILNSLCHLLKFTGNEPVRPRVRLGTDSSVAQASFTRGFNTHSYDINECLRRIHDKFGARADIEYVHIPGHLNPADAVSRGADASKVNWKEATTSLRRLVGDGNGPSLHEGLRLGAASPAQRTAPRSEVSHRCLLVT